METNKKLSRGIFWVLAETESEITAQNILALRAFCDFNGNVSDSLEFTSKDGLTFNHKQTWARLSKNTTRSKPYDYYPRGRVEVVRGKATVWLNENVLSLADEISNLYGLSALDGVRIKVDGSSHYKCHFDKNYKQEKF